MEVSKEFRLQQVPYEHSDVASLEAAAQQFYVQLYGLPDETPFTTADFSPPRGAFFVGYLNEAPVAMGVGDFARQVCRAWRSGRPKYGGCSSMSGYEDKGLPASCWPR